MKFSGEAKKIEKISKHFSVNKKLQKKINIIPQWGGGPPIFVHPNSYFFCELKPRQNFRTLGQLFLGEMKPKQRKERERDEKKNAVNSGHFMTCTTIGMGGQILYDQ